MFVLEETKEVHEKTNSTFAAMSSTMFLQTFILLQALFCFVCIVLLFIRCRIQCIPVALNAFSIKLLIQSRGQTLSM